MIQEDTKKAVICLESYPMFSFRNCRGCKDWQAPWFWIHAFCQERVAIFNIDRSIVLAEAQVSPYQSLDMSMMSSLHQIDYQHASNSIPEEGLHCGRVTCSTSVGLGRRVPAVVVGFDWVRRARLQPGSRSQLWGICLRVSAQGRTSSGIDRQCLLPISCSRGVD